MIQGITVLFATLQGIIVRLGELFRNRVILIRVNLACPRGAFAPLVRQDVYLVLLLRSWPDGVLKPLHDIACMAHIVKCDLICMGWSGSAGGIP